MLLWGSMEVSKVRFTSNKLGVAGGSAKLLFEAFTAPAVPPRLARAVTATVRPSFSISQQVFNLLKRRSRNHPEDSFHLYYSYGLPGLIPGEGRWAGGEGRGGTAGRHNMKPKGISGTAGHLRNSSGSHGIECIGFQPRYMAFINEAYSKNTHCCDLS